MFKILISVVLGLTTLSANGEDKDEHKDGDFICNSKIIIKDIVPYIGQDGKIKVNTITEKPKEDFIIATYKSKCKRNCNVVENYLIGYTFKFPQFLFRAVDRICKQKTGKLDWEAVSMCVARVDGKDVQWVKIKCERRGEVK